MAAYTWTRQTLVSAVFATGMVTTARSVQRHAQPVRDVSVRIYKASHHGFDGFDPVRLRRDVPRGRSPHGAHQGGNPQTRMESLSVLEKCWRRVFGTCVAP